jgi:hypothetical protein
VERAVLGRGVPPQQGEYLARGGRVDLADSVSERGRPGLILLPDRPVQFLEQ